MYSVNTVPSNDDSKLVKTLAFPFQMGNSGLPAMARPENKVYNMILELISTGPGERVMNYPMGINVYHYVFSDMTPIQRARLANEVSTAIETYIPGVIVNSVSSHDLSEEDSSLNGVVFSIEYSVNGQSEAQQIYYNPAIGEL
jgi:phage baseplate assembly protein W